MSIFIGFSCGVSALFYFLENDLDLEAYFLISFIAFAIICVILMIMILKDFDKVTDSFYIVSIIEKKY